MSDRGAANHIGEADLIDLALGALAPERLEGVLTHIAGCDLCSERSARIHRIDGIWEDWRERIAETEPAAEPSWVAAAAGAVREALSRSGTGGWLSVPSLPAGALAYLLSPAKPVLGSAVQVAGGIRTRGKARGDSRTIVLRSGRTAAAEVLREVSGWTIAIGGWPEGAGPPVVRLVTSESAEPLTAEPGAEPGTWRCVVGAPPVGVAILIGEAGGES
jgi:anti-sigma factor RsiW